MKSSDHIDSASNLVIQVGGSLALIVFIIIGAGWLLRRSGTLRQLRQTNAALRIKETLTVGSRERVLLVEVNNRQLLLGVTATQITCLASFDRPNQSDVANSDTGDFGAALSQRLTGYNG